MKQLFASFLLVLTSCAQQSPTGSNSNMDIIRQYFQLFNQHDWQGMAALYADTCTFKDPSLGHGPVKQSRQQVVAKYTELAQAFPNVKDEVLQTYACGDHYIVVEFISKGSGRDGTTFELPICTIFTIEQGKIVQDFTYYDNF